VPVLDAEAEGLLAFARGAGCPAASLARRPRDGPTTTAGLHLWITARMTHVFGLAVLLGSRATPSSSTTGRRPWHDVRRPRARRLVGRGPRRPARREDKAAYEHAFVLLAASTAGAAGRPGAAEAVGRGGGRGRRALLGAGEGAVAEGFARDWSSPEAYRGANANMHMVEACLAAGDVSGDPGWAARALSTAEKLIAGAARAHHWRVVEHFDAAWRPLPDYNSGRPRDPFRPFGVTPGHGLEWARLLVHLSLALPDPPAWLLPAARGLFERALADGWEEPAGGIVYTTGLDGRPVVRDRFHWVVAEAIGAAAVLHAATGEPGYRRWQERLLAYARTRLADGERGSWHHELDPENRPAARTWQGKPDVYHALQALLLGRLPLAPSLAGAARAGQRGMSAAAPARRASSSRRARRRAAGTSPAASTTTSR
jgi:mannose/cellobiose epimerase-like protein (N-acyl-D-glucosamine 2-epimerase family)